MAQDTSFESIEKLLQSTNPLMFLLQALSLQHRINDLFFQVGQEFLDIKSIWLLEEIHSSLIDVYKSKNYHHQWLANMQEYILDSKYFDIWIYRTVYAQLYANPVQKDKIDITLLQNSTIAKQDLQKLSFNQIFKLVKEIERSFTRRTVAYSQDPSFMQEAEELIKKFPSSKSLFEARVVILIDRYASTQQEKISLWKCVRTYLIQKRYQPLLNNYMWHQSLIYLSQKDFYQSRSKLTLSMTKIPESFSILKSTLLKIMTNSLMGLFRPLLFTQLKNILLVNFSSQELVKLKYYFLYYICQNYEEYKALYSFFFLFDDSVSKSIWAKIRLWLPYILLFSFFIAFSMLFLPLGVFLGLSLLIWSYLFSFFPDAKITLKYNMAFKMPVNILSLVLIICSMYFSIMIHDFESFKNGYRSTKTMINALGAITAADVLQLSNEFTADASGFKSKVDEIILERLNRDYLVH